MAITKKVKARPKSTKATGRKRNYDTEYSQYHGKPAQIKKRAQRNSARSTMAKTGAVKKGDGKVVDHKKPIRSGGTNAKSNLRVTSRSKNAGWRKGKKG
jgi:hypothetical protein